MKPLLPFPRSWLLASLCLMAAVHPSFARTPYTPKLADPVEMAWRWRLYPEVSGQGLESLAQTPDGALWFGTRMGAVRYDGVVWTTFDARDGLSSTPVVDLQAGSDGGLYAATPSGISSYDGTAWRKVFPPDDHIWPVNALSVSNRILAATPWGLVEMADEGPVLYTSSDMGAAVSSIAPWIRITVLPDSIAAAEPWGSGIGVRILDAGRLADGDRVTAIVWAVHGDSPAERAGIQVGDIIVAVDGRALTRSAEGMVETHLDGDPGTIIRVGLESGRTGEGREATLRREELPGATHSLSLNHVLETDALELFLALGQGGIIRKPKSGEWKAFGQSEGLVQDSQPVLAQSRDGHIWVATNDQGAGLQQFNGGTWKETKLSDIGGRDINTSILETSDGTLWVGGSGRLHALRNGKWSIYSLNDLDLPSHRIRMIEGRDGALWLAGLGQGAARLDLSTPRWTSYEQLNYQAESPNGARWFVSQDFGVARQTGPEWERFGVEDGLMALPWGILTTGSTVWAFGSDGQMAASTSRFDDATQTWRTKSHPTLAHFVSFHGSLAASDGSVWFGAQADYVSDQGHQGGVLRHRAGAWEHHPPPMGPEFVYAIAETDDGLWFGGSHLRHYNRSTWEAITEPQGLASWILDIKNLGNRLWVATRTNGLFERNVGQWIQHRKLDGLPDDRIDAVVPLPGGQVIAAAFKGASRYDGTRWTPDYLPEALFGDLVEGGIRKTRDGILYINNAVQEGRGFRIWTHQYRADNAPPDTRILTEIDRISYPGTVSIAWAAQDPWHATPTEALQFSWRLNGGEWSPFASSHDQLFMNLPSRHHTLDVRARDLDFNIDPSPASLTFVVVPPVWRQPWFIALISLLGFAIGLQSVRVVKRDRELKAAQTQLIKELENELQKASELQQGLMPTHHPSLEGYEIAGLCVPATHVGGDFFQYYPDGNRRLTVTMADVTGHAMEAAIPMVMFSGMLQTHMALGGRVQEHFERLNVALHGNLPERTFVCFVMGELDLDTNVLTVSDSGCPFPYHYQASQNRLVEIPIDAYPLGVRPDTEYLEAEVTLGPGDRIVFCSDGIMEAGDEMGNQFGYDRTADVILDASRRDLSPSATIDLLFGTVRTFCGDASPEDDMTAVVIVASR